MGWKLSHLLCSPTAKYIPDFVSRVRDPSEYLKWSYIKRLQYLSGILELHSVADHTVVFDDAEPFAYVPARLPGGERSPREPPRMEYWTLVSMEKTAVFSCLFQIMIDDKRNKLIHNGLFVHLHHSIFCLLILSSCQ